MSTYDEVIPKLNLPVSKKVRHDRVVRESKVEDLFDPHFDYLTHLEVKERKRKNGTTYMDFRPSLSQGRIRSMFYKDENNIAKLSFPGHHVVSRSQNEFLQLSETYTFNKEGTQKLCTSFLATRDGEPIPASRSKKLDILRVPGKYIQSVTTVNVQIGDLYVLAFISLKDRTHTVLIYTLEDLLAFPSDHPCITPEEGKEVGFANGRVIHISVHSPEGAKQQYTHSSFKDSQDILDSLVEVADYRLSSHVNELSVYREVFSPSKNNLVALKERDTGTHVRVVDPVDFVLEVIEEASQLHAEIGKNENYPYRTPFTLDFLISHFSTEDGKMTSRARFLLGDEKIQEIETTYDPEGTDYPFEMFDAVNRALVGGSTKEELCISLPQDFPVRIVL